MLDFEKIYELLRIALITGAINSLFVQKIKCKFMDNDCILVIISFIFSMIIGTLFALSFTKLSFVYSLWVGLFTFIHAEAIYKVLKNYNLKNQNNSDIEAESEEDLGEG